MNRIYYTIDGWVCGRAPQMFEIDDETRFIEVDEEAYNSTFLTASGYAWRVVDGVLENVIIEEQVAAEQKRDAQINELKTELAKIKEDIEQETFGLVREDYAEKKNRAAEIINELRILEGKEPREVNL